MNQIFISYSHTDKEYAHKLHQYLIERDFRAWIDDKIDYGSRWQKQVEKQLRECDVFILIMSPDSEKSDWVQNELLLAKQLNKTIYTFLLEGDRWWNVQSIQFVDVRHGEMPSEKFILSLAKVISESDSENSKNVTINIGGNVQGNIVVGDENTIDSSINKISESKPAKQNYDFRKLSIRVIVLIGVLGSLFAGNYFLNNLPTSETPEITPTEEITVTSTFEPTATATKSLAISTTTRFGVGSTSVGNDGMTLMYVPAGEFIMGTNSQSNDESPEHQVNLDAFWIDQTEVTNSMYSQCVNESTCNPPDKANSATHAEYFGNSEFDNYPVIFISWNDANDYCFWAGRRLPTEAEWEKAARGTRGSLYPWGNANPKDNLLNYNGNIGDTTVVGNYPAGVSEFGVFDMAGNVWEWVEDWWDPDYYQISPLINPYGPDSGEYRILRGGSWSGVFTVVHSTYRYPLAPTNTDAFLGFRCAMDAD